MRKAPAALALYFPVSQWFGSGRHAPHYAYQLLLRACGVCDIAHEQAVLERGDFGAVRALALLEVRHLPASVVPLLGAFLRQGGHILCDESTVLPAGLEGQPGITRLGGRLEERFRAAAEGADSAARAALMEEIRGWLRRAGVEAEACADHEEVETSVLRGDGLARLVAVNHAAVPVRTAVRLRGRAEPLRLDLPARGGRLVRLEGEKP